MKAEVDAAEDKLVRKKLLEFERGGSVFAATFQNDNIPHYLPINVVECTSYTYKGSDYSVDDPYTHIFMPEIDSGGNNRYSYESLSISNKIPAFIKPFQECVALNLMPAMFLKYYYIVFDDTVPSGVIISGKVIPWSDITVVKNYKYTYFIVENMPTRNITEYSEEDAIEMLLIIQVIPNKVKYTETNLSSLASYPNKILFNSNFYTTQNINEASYGLAILDDNLITLRYSKEDIITNTVQEGPGAGASFLHIILPEECEKLDLYKSNIDITFGNIEIPENVARMLGKNGISLFSGLHIMIINSLAINEALKNLGLDTFGVTVYFYKNAPKSANIVHRLGIPYTKMVADAKTFIISGGDESVSYIQDVLDMDTPGKGIPELLEEKGYPYEYFDKLYALTKHNPNMVSEIYKDEVYYELDEYTGINLRNMIKTGLNNARKLYIPRRTRQNKLSVGVLIFIDGLLLSEDVILENRIFTAVIPENKLVFSPDIIPSNIVEVMFIYDNDARTIPITAENVGKVKIFEGTRISDYELYAYEYFPNSVFKLKANQNTRISQNFGYEYDVIDDTYALLDFGNYEILDIGPIKYSLVQTLKFFRYHENIKFDTVAVDLDERFKCCRNEPRYLVFINGKRVNISTYTLSFPDNDFPFETTSMYFYLGLSTGDVLDVFYMPCVFNDINTGLSVDEENIGLITVGGGALKLMASSSALPSGKGPSSYGTITLNKYFFLYFINGQKIPTSCLYEINSNTIKIINMTVSCRDNITCAVASSQYRFSIVVDTIAKAAKNYTRGRSSKNEELMDYLLEYQCPISENKNFVNTDTEENLNDYLMPDSNLLTEIYKDHYSKYNEGEPIIYYFDSKPNGFGDGSIVQDPYGATIVDASNGNAQSVNVAKDTEFLIYGVSINLTSGIATYTDDAIGIEAMSMRENGVIDYGGWEKIIKDFLGVKPAVYYEGEIIDELDENDYTKYKNGAISSAQVTDKLIKGTEDLITTESIYGEYQINDTVLSSFTPNYAAATPGFPVGDIIYDGYQYIAICADEGLALSRATSLTGTFTEFLNISTEDYLSGDDPYSLMRLTAPKLIFKGDQIRNRYSTAYIEVKQSQTPGAASMPSRLGLLISDDGEKFVQHTFGEFIDSDIVTVPTTLDYNDDMYIILCYRLNPSTGTQVFTGNNCFISKDNGLTVTGYRIPLETDYKFKDIIYRNGIIFAIDSVGSRVVSSNDDGLTWSFSGVSSVPVRIKYYENKDSKIFFIILEDGTILYTVNGINLIVYETDLKDTKMNPTDIVSDFEIHNNFMVVVFSGASVTETLEQHIVYAHIESTSTSLFDIQHFELHTRGYNSGCLLERVSYLNYGFIFWDEYNANSFADIRILPITLTKTGYHDVPTTTVGGLPYETTSEETQYGDALVEFAPRYYKMSIENGSFVFKVSNYKPDESYIYDAFDMDILSESDAGGVYDPTTHTMYKMAYAAYEGFKEYHTIRSISGIAPTVGDSKFDLEITASNKGYGQLSFAKQQYIIGLVLLLGKTLDYKSVFGKGYAYDKHLVHLETGSLDKAGLFYGTNKDDVGVKVLGIENLWGNLTINCEGYINYDKTIYYRSRGLYSESVPYGSTGTDVPLTEHSTVLLDYSKGTLVLPANISDMKQLNLSLNGSVLTFIPKDQINVSEEVNTISSENSIYPLFIGGINLSTVEGQEVYYKGSDGFGSLNTGVRLVLCGRGKFPK